MFNINRGMGVEEKKSKRGGVLEDDPVMQDSNANKQGLLVLINAALAHSEPENRQTPSDSFVSPLQSQPNIPISSTIRQPEIIKNPDLNYGPNPVSRWRILSRPLRVSRMEAKNPRTNHPNMSRQASPSLHHINKTRNPSRGLLCWRAGPHLSLQGSRDTIDTPRSRCS